MKEFKVGEIVKVQVIGSQHYGIFTKSLDDESYTGLIHISEISKAFHYEFYLFYPTKILHLLDNSIKKDYS